MYCNPIALLLAVSSVCQGSCILRQSFRNRYGDTQYEPAYKNVGRRWRPADLDPTQVWVVKNPTATCYGELQETFPELLLQRRYGPNVFLMTPAAANVIPDYNEGGSCACVIEAYNDSAEGKGEKYFLMVGSAKRDYVQTCQGRFISGDPRAAMQKILEEKLHLKVEEWELFEVGEWTFPVRERIVEVFWDRKSYAFHLRLPLSRLNHLLPSFFHHLPPPTDPLVIPCFLRPDLQTLRNVAHLLLVPEACLETAPEVIDSAELVEGSSVEVRHLTFADHHRDFVRIRAGLPSKNQHPHLTSFRIRPLRS